MALQQTSQRRWQQTLDLHLARLGKHAHIVQKTLDAQTFDLWLHDYADQAHSAPLTKLANDTDRFLGPLRQFAKAIDTMSNANPIACLVWGSIQAVLILARAWTSIIDSLSNMLLDLTHTLPLFEQYMSIFRRVDNLEEVLRELYDEYVKFCIKVVLFFKRKRWSFTRGLVMFQKVFWGNVQNDFEEAKAKIAMLRTRFLERANAAHANTTVATFQTVASMSRFANIQKTLRIGVPFERNARFQGRNQDLQTLHQNLFPQGSKAILGQCSCVIHGMGGIGKTQTALEYTYRFEKSYNFILWATAESGPELADAFSHFAKSLAPDEASQDQKLNATIVRDWLGRHDKWLLVFDNLDNVSLNDYWPATSHGSIIVTTQRQDRIGRATSQLLLEAFEEEDGSELILKLIRRTWSQADAQTWDHSDKNTWNLAKKVSNEVGGLPLLLSHVSGYLGVTDHPQGPLQDMLRDLQDPEHFKEIWKFNSTTSTNFQYQRLMDLVWAKALQALEPHALDTIHILSMLSPGGVQEEVLIGEWADPELVHLAPSRDFEFRKVRKNLVDRHLVTLSSVNTLFVHRSLMRHILQLIENEGDQKFGKVFAQALAICRKAFPRGSDVQGPTNHTWSECETALPHVLSLRSIFINGAARLQPSRALATLAADAVNYLWERGQIHECIKTLKFGEDVCNKMPGDNEVVPTHANICAISGAVHAELGFGGRSKGVEKCREALELRKRRVSYLESINSTVTKEDGMLLANGYNDTAVVNLQQEDWTAADPCNEEALKLKHQYSTEEDNPVQFGESYKNMAIVRLAQGKVDEARDLAKRGYELYGKEIPEKSAATQKAKFVWCLVLFNSGEIEAAKKLAKGILEVRREIFGDKHQLVKDSLYMVGTIHKAQGKLEKAEKCFRQSIEHAELSDLEEETLARSQYHLVGTIRAQPDRMTDDREKEAKDLETSARAVRDKFAGLLPDEIKANGPDRIHDYMVSIWSGRTIGILNACNSGGQPLPSQAVNSASPQANGRIASPGP